MFSDDATFKKDLMIHKVFSSWQFIQNAKKNMLIADFAANTIKSIIENLTDETQKWEQDLFQGFRVGETFSVSVTTDNLPEHQISVAGKEVNGFFLVDKLIKDFYQYSRNSFDSIGQIANSGLLANKGKAIDKTDFPAMVTKFAQATYKAAFPLTAAWFEAINVSPEFRYIDAINNRTKHTVDVTTKLGIGILGSGTTAEIRPFFRNDAQHGKQDLSNQLDATLSFISDAFEKFLVAFCAEYPNGTFSNDRIHTIEVYQQKFKDNPGSNFSYAHIPCHGNYGAMPDEINVLLVAEYDHDVIARDCPFNTILVSNTSHLDIVGRYIAEDKVGDDCLHRYRKYKKDAQTNVPIYLFQEMEPNREQFYHKNPFFNVTVVSDDDNFLARSTLPF